MTKNGPSERALFTATLLLVALAALSSCFRYYSGDEFEHIHAAWYVSRGIPPFTGFYEHHHPLFYYLLAPLIRVFGEGVGSLRALRVVAFLLGMGSVAMAGRLAWRVSRSREAAFVAAIILLSTYEFVHSGLEVRPDNPQVLFALLAVDGILSYLEGESKRAALMAGIWAGVSFAFLQKTVLLLLVLVPLFIYECAARRRFLASGLLFIPGFLISSFVLIAPMFLGGVSFSDYFLTNWLLNMHPAIDGFTPFAWIARSPASWPVWLIAPGILFLAVVKSGRAGSGSRRALVFLTFGTFVTLFFMKWPYDQYYLLLFALLSALGGAVFTRERTALLVVFAFFGTSAAGYYWIKHPNQEQLKEVEFVLQNTTADEPVFDGVPDFNVFRPDLHYFWFHFHTPGHGLVVYNALTGGKYAGFDACRLIAERRPKFVNSRVFDEGLVCSWKAPYAPSGFPGLFRLKAGSGT